MLDVVSVDLMRESDKNTIENKVSALSLINNAANALYSAHNYNKTAIVCGSGNNAADGYRLAALLKNNNKLVDLFLCSDSFSKEGLFLFNEAKKLGINYKRLEEADSFNSYDTVVDCIFGTGFHGEPNEYYSMVIDKINNSGKYIISADINSGLNGNNGLAIKAVKSDLTVAFGAYKYGLLLNDAKDYIKKLICVDVEIDLLKSDGFLLDEEAVKSFFKPRLNNTNKGTYGYVGIMGGSSNYLGAVKLASLGQNALYSGAGVSRIIVPKEIAGEVRGYSLESTVYPFISNNGNFVFDELELSKAIKGLKAIGIGVGIGVSDDIKKVLEYLLNTYSGTLIIDADALNCLSQMNVSLINSSRANVILTPHLKELSRLTGYSVDYIKENTVLVGKEFVSKYNATLLIKGPTTIVLNRSEMYFVDKGAPGMATAGSGDVLTGILTGIMGYSYDSICFATAVGAYINGYAGELASQEYGDYGMVSSDTARMVSKVMRKLS